MPQSYVIEIDEQSVGVVVRAEGARRFVFHAAESGFGALDGRSFPSVKAAEKAASGLDRKGSERAVSGRRRFATGGR